MHYEKAPNIPEAKKHLAKLYKAGGRQADPIGVWKAILEKKPQDVDALEARKRWVSEDSRLFDPSITVGAR